MLLDELIYKFSSTSLPYCGYIPVWLPNCYALKVLLLHLYRRRYLVSVWQNYVVVCVGLFALR